MNHGEVFCADESHVRDTDTFFGWSSKTQCYEPAIVGKWYHYDETWSNCYGPYDTEDEACAALLEYARSL